MRTIGVVTVARSDYGIYRPVLRTIAADGELDLALFAAGTHLADDHGATIAEIEADGFPIRATIETLARSDDAVVVAQGAARGLAGFAEAFATGRPDVVVVLGDRFEMLAAAFAALLLRLPVAHIHGGEASEGAFDESIRHALTKLSHLHFAATETAARRIRQLGEEPWRIVVCGAPALDEIARLEPLTAEQLEERMGMPLDPPPLVVTYHPATLDPRDAGELVQELLAAVEQSGLPAVFTYPNADPGGIAVRRAIEAYAAGRSDARVVPSLGTRVYYSLLRHAVAVLGNSSSGIIEAASFGVPVVNVGIRQNGRLRPPNVIDVDDDRDAVLAGIRRAIAPGLRSSLAGLVNPYGDGKASERIVATLRAVELGPRLLRKRFYELDG
jgi:UDP-hydrolysing UDP-N-acetyl-D-glucosamine 2-epimerase